jgi:hypothetical protein
MWLSRGCATNLPVGANASLAAVSPKVNYPRRAKSFNHFNSQNKSCMSSLSAHGCRFRHRTRAYRSLSIHDIPQNLGSLSRSLATRLSRNPRPNTKKGRREAIEIHRLQRLFRIHIIGKRFPYFPKIRVSKCIKSAE